MDELTSQDFISEGSVRILRRIFVVTALIIALRGNVTQAQQLSTNQVIDRIVQRENEEMKTLHQYDPIVETYAGSSSRQ